MWSYHEMRVQLRLEGDTNKILCSYTHMNAAAVNASAESEKCMMDRRWSAESLTCSLDDRPALLDRNLLWRAFEVGERFVKELRCVRTVVREGGRKGQPWF